MLGGMKRFDTVGIVWVSFFRFVSNSFQWCCEYYWYLTDLLYCYRSYGVCIYFFLLIWRESEVNRKKTMYIEVKSDESATATEARVPAINRPGLGHHK